jgi:NADH dehydrogenase
MRVAITGGTGFVGGHLAVHLARLGHDVIVVARGTHNDGEGAIEQAGVQVVRADVTEADALARAFAGCNAVAHCAGINREIGRQTYRSVHVNGTAAVVRAAQEAGVGRIVSLSFLRARPNGPTAYHRSKWAAEEIVRSSGLQYTIVKASVMYGRGDHLLDHLSRAFHTFPVFALVGFRDRPIAPLAVHDAVQVLAAACLGDPRLAKQDARGRGTAGIAAGDGGAARRGCLPSSPDLHFASRRRARRDRVDRRADDARPASLGGAGEDPRRGGGRAAAVR